MPKKLQLPWPEAFVSTADVTVAVSRAVKAGRLRKLASRLYTRNLNDPPKDVVRRNLWQIAAAISPAAWSLTAPPWRMRRHATVPSASSPSAAPTSPCPGWCCAPAGAPGPSPATSPYWWAVPVLDRPRLPG